MIGPELLLLAADAKSEAELEHLSKVLMVARTALGQLMLVVAMTRIFSALGLPRMMV